EVRPCSETPLQRSEAGGPPEVPFLRHCVFVGPACLSDRMNLGRTRSATDVGWMWVPALLGVPCALLLGALAASTSHAAPPSDLAVLRIRVPAHARLSDARLRASADGAVRIANRGAEPVVVADAALLARLVRLNAASLDGPIACAPVGVAPAVAGVRFPLVLRPTRGRTLHYTLDFTCGANPGRAPDWTFSAIIDHATLDGTGDDDPTDDVCPRAPSASDRGCGVIGPHDARLPPTTDVRDTRA